MVSTSSIQVVVRLRPMNEKEKAEGTLPVISASASQKTVTVIKGVGSKQARSSFHFDNVFTSFSNQSEVFSATLQPVIGDVLKGYETCVFAYGQTGTGKTHTMEGNLNDPDQYGVIPRSAQALFDSLQSPAIIESKISCSYLEIYNEELRDLLDPSEKKKMDVMSTGKSVKCRGLSKQIVKNAKDVLFLMQKAAQSRKVGETRMNRQSSRSHCIFTLSVNASKKLSNGSVLESHGKLHMVDLAGSESAKTAELKDSSARDQATREQERRNINKSLLTLGRVITSLKEQTNGGKKKSSQIPYRDSKLTRILQEALGGHCKTVIIAAISPSVLNLQESLQTLHYAQAANGIQNKISTASSYLTVQGGSNAQNGALHGDNGDTSNSNGMYAVERWQEMEIRMEHMQHEVEEARQALARNYLQHQELIEKAETAEKEQQGLQQQLQDSHHTLDETKKKLNEEVGAKVVLRKELEQTVRALQKTTTILRATQDTEVALTSEAKALILALQNSILNSENLHKSIEKNREEKVTLRESTRTFQNALISVLQIVVSNLEELDTNQDDEVKRMNAVLSNDSMERRKAINVAQTVVSDIAKAVASLSKTIEDNLSNNMAPTLDSLASNLQTTVKKTQHIFEDGEKHLAESCLDARNQLDAFAKVLDGHRDRNMKATHESQSRMEKALDNVKNQVESLAQHAISNLGKAREHEKRTTEALKTVIVEWKNCGFTATNKVLDISTAQKLALGETTGVLNAEMKHHNAIKEELLSQSHMLKAKQKFQSRKLNNQFQMLQYHRTEIEENKQSHAKLCNHVVETVMDGVKNLLSEQLKMIIADNETHTEQLVGTQLKLKSINEELQVDAEEFFNGLKATNHKLISKGNIMEKTDKLVLQKLKDGHKGFSSINEITNDFLTEQETISKNSGKLMETLESLNLGITNISERVDSDKKRCLETIDSNVRGVARESVSQLSNISSHALTYSRDEIIEKTKSKINEILDPRIRVKNDALTMFDSLNETTNCGISHLNTISNTLSKSTKEINSLVQNSDSVFSSIACELHRSQNIKSYDKMVGILKINSETSKDIIHSCKENIFDIDKKGKKFSQNDIKMDVAVPAMSPIVNIEYKKLLSSTADKDITLKDCIDLRPESTEVRTRHPTSLGVNHNKLPSVPADLISPVFREKSQNKKESDSKKFSFKRRSMGDTNRLMKRKKYSQ